MSTDHLAIASSSVLGLKIAFLDKIVIFRPNIELEAIARQSIEASREFDCAYFGNIGRNSGYFLLPIFLGSYLIVDLSCLLQCKHKGEKYKFKRHQFPTLGSF